MAPPTAAQRTPEAVRLLIDGEAGAVELVAELAQRLNLTVTFLPANADNPAEADDSPEESLQAGQSWFRYKGRLYTCNEQGEVVRFFPSM